MEVMKELSIRNSKKIVLSVLDGLGGLPAGEWDKTELETALTPNLDSLAAVSECGLHNPLGIGITPGSAPGHLALFGYKPFDYPIGRGVVAAMGIAFPMKDGDVAVRVNFATMNKTGKITDRRAGRISTEKCSQLCTMLQKISIKDVEVFVKPVKDHRAVVIFRGEDLSGDVSDTDPQAIGVRSLEPAAITGKGKKMVGVAAEFIAKANSVLNGQRPANTVLMRGFAELPYIPSMKEIYRLSPLALAVYPDYKGVSRLVGMDVIEGLQGFDDQAKALHDSWDRYDFFFIHYKYTDSTGEDGDFKSKVAEIEKADTFIPHILKQKPDVLVVTGDHSTPAVCAAHSGHAVPFLIHGKETRPDGVTEFGERNCVKGIWGGTIKGDFLMRLMMSYSGKLRKYGA